MKYLLDQSVDQILRLQMRVTFLKTTIDFTVSNTVFDQKRKKPC